MFELKINSNFIKPINYTIHVWRLKNPATACWSIYWRRSPWQSEYFQPSSSSSSPPPGSSTASSSWRYLRRSTSPSRPSVELSRPHGLNKTSNNFMRIRHTLDSQRYSLILCLSNSEENNVVFYPWESGKFWQFLFCIVCIDLHVTYNSETTIVYVR